MNKALFLDRDGIINVDSGYVYQPDKMIINLEILIVVREAIAMGYKIIVVTNQSGVAKGYYTEDDVRRVHRWLGGIFHDLCIPITAFYYCLLDGDQTFTRKPNPGMIVQAVKDHDIDLTKSLMVGDKPSDRIKHADLKSIIIHSKYEPDNYDIVKLQDIVPFLTFG